MIPAVAQLEQLVAQYVAAVVASLGGEVDPVDLPLSAVPDGRWGDVALPCFVLRQRLSALDAATTNNPAAIAKALQSRFTALLEGTEGSGIESTIADAIRALVAEVRAVGPYLNLAYRTSTIMHAVIGEVLASQDGFGGRGVRKPEHVVIEFSAPNTNKPQHLGHVRNNVLGEAVSRCMSHAGHRVTKVNLVNDRGIHICKSMLAYQQWGDGIDPAKAHKKGDHLIGDFYVLFESRFRDEYDAWQATPEAEERLAAWRDTPEGSAAVSAYESYQAALAAAQAPSEANVEAGKKSKAKKVRAAALPSAAFFASFKDTYFNELSPLGLQARDMLLAWEAGDEQVRALWGTLNAWVLDGFERTYDRLGVSFAHVYRESETYTLGKDIIDDGLARAIFRRRDDGAVVFDLAPLGVEGEKVMLRSDGTSVYITQDLGTAMARFEAYAFERMIYVVANEQDYHFKVLFAALEKLNPILERRFEHLSYGMVNLPHGRMKSREGTVVDADELMDEMHRLARVEIDSKLAGEHYQEIDAAELERRAETIGLAGLKYFLLDVTPTSSMEFDPEKSIDLQGRTGAYCLYNYARTRSLLRKAGGVPEIAPDALSGTLEQLGTPEERRVVMHIARFPGIVEWASEHRDPSKVAEYLFELCKAFAFIFTDRKGHPIVSCPEPALRAARLCLVESVGTVLRIGLRLLGVQTLEEM